MLIPLKIMICEVLGCTNRTSNKKKGITFHRFPYDEVLKQKWINALTRDDWSPNPLGKVCSIHFKPKDILKNPPVKTMLVKTAVPSIFPPSKYEISSKSANETPPIPMDVEIWNASNEDSLVSPDERLNDSTNEKISKNIRNKFSVISELANDMNSIKSKINQHLRTRRAKNCRIKIKIEKLKHFLADIKEETSSYNPMLESLFDNALKEPDCAEIDEQSNHHHSSSKEAQNETLQIEQSELVLREKTNNSFASYLTNELKKLHPKDLALVKEDIQNILESNQPVNNNL